MKRAYGDKLFESNDKALLDFFAKAELKTRARIENIKNKFQSKVSSYICESPLTPN